VKIRGSHNALGNSSTFKSLHKKEEKKRAYPVQRAPALCGVCIERELSKKKWITKFGPQCFMDYNMRMHNLFFQKGEKKFEPTATSPPPLPYYYTHPA